MTSINYSHTTQNSTFIQLGASNHSKGEREVNDFYSTDPEAIHGLLSVENIEGGVLEPSCGNGNIGKVLEEHGCNVEAFDLIDRGYGRQQDFLQYNERINRTVVMNPPYKNAQEHIEHALELMEDGTRLYVLLKIQFLESVGRKKLYDKYPLKKVYVFRRRTACYKNDDRSLNSRAICYAWFVWEKGYNGEARVSWIDH